MIEVTQTIQSGEKANCYAACVASIFELDIERLPVLPDEDVIAEAHKHKAHKTTGCDDGCSWSLNDKRNEFWWDMWGKFFTANNLLPMRFDYATFTQYERERVFKESWHILSGRSPRDKEGKENGNGRRHAVVGRNGVIWFDPFPSREGLASIEEIELIVPRDPAKPILAAYNKEV